MSVGGGVVGWGDEKGLIDCYPTFAFGLSPGADQTDWD